MSALTTKLDVTNGSTVKQCTCYTTIEEATPTTITGGSYWQVNNNGVTAYIGLWPKSVSGGSYHTDLTITKDGIDYYAETQVINTYNVTITQSAHQTIKVTCDGSEHTTSFVAPAGASYTVVVTPDTGYTAGSPSSTSGNVNNNLTITATAATIKTYTVTITQSANETITVTANGTNYTQTFTADHGTTWTAAVAGATGYNPGALSASSGTLTGNIIITVGAATLKTYTVTITQSAHETITVTAGGSGHTSSFTANHGTTWTAAVAADTGWNAGALSASSGTLTGNITITVGAATYKTFTLTKSATNASTNQTLTVQYQNKKSDGTFETKTTLSSGSVTLGYGSHWWGTVSASTGYNAGAVTNAGGDSSSLTSNITVSVAAASLKTYTLTKSATNASTNQTLNVFYSKATSSSAWNTEATLSSGSVTLTHFSKWRATVTNVTTGWNAGAITNAGGDSARMTGNVTVSIAAATYKTFTLTRSATNASTNQTLHVYYKNKASNGTLDSSWTELTASVGSKSLGYGSQWYTAVDGVTTGWNAGTVTNAKTSGSPGTMTSNVTVSITAATYKSFTLTKSATNASTNQTLTVQYQNKASNGTFGTKTTLSSGSVSLGYGSHWWGTVSGVTTGWNAGAITNPGGDSSSLTSNVTVSIAAATYKSFTLTKSATNASTNQTLTVQYQNKASSGSFGTKTTLSSGSVSLGYGSHWWGTVSQTTAQSTYWTKGAVTNAGGDSSSLTSNVTVSVAAATQIKYTITLTQKANETVTIYYKNHNGSSLASSWSSTTASVTLGKGSQYYSTIALSGSYTSYYAVGSITSAGTSSSPNTLNGNVTLSFTAATHITYTLSLTQKANETVTIHYKNHSGTALASSWSTATASVTLGKGSQYYSTIALSGSYTSYYTVGSITSAGSSSSPNTLNAAATISFTAASHITYVLTLAGTSNQTITLYYKNHSGTALDGSWTSKTSTGSNQTFTLGKGSQYYSTIAGASGYNPGTITNPGTSSAPNTLNAAATVSASAASVVTRTVTIKRYHTTGTATGTEEDGIPGTTTVPITYTDASGTNQTATSPTFTIKNNTTIKFTYANQGYTTYVGKRYKTKYKIGNASHTLLADLDEVGNSYTSSAITSDIVFTWWTARGSKA